MQTLYFNLIDNSINKGGDCCYNILRSTVFILIIDDGQISFLLSAPFFCVSPVRLDFRLMIVVSFEYVAFVAEFHPTWDNQNYNVSLGKIKSLTLCQISLTDHWLIHACCFVSAIPSGQFPSHDAVGGGGVWSFPGYFLHT